MRELPKLMLHPSPVEDEVPAAESFETFFQAESETLFRRLCLITGNRIEAEELMQDAFLRLWERWDRVRRLEDPTGYLYRTAMNEFRKRTRRAALAVRKTVSAPLRKDEFASADTRADVRTALARLSPRQRAAVVLIDLIGYSSEEAAQALGVRPGTARALASQARAALRRTMEADDV